MSFRHTLSCHIRVKHFRGFQLLLGDACPGHWKEFSRTGDYQS